MCLYVQELQLLSRHSSCGVVWTIVLSGFDPLPEQGVALLKSVLVVSGAPGARCSVYKEDISQIQVGRCVKVTCSLSLIQGLRIRGSVSPRPIMLHDVLVINLLAPELFFLILAHPVHKM